MSDKLKPLFLTKPGTINRKDIARTEKLCGIVIIECLGPESTRFCEPPLGADLNEQARAALALMRTVLNHPLANFSRGELTKWFVDELLSWNAPSKVANVEVESKGLK